MKWLWQNTTQVGFGENAVSDHLSKFVQPKSKVLCTFGGGSIDKNGCRSDVQAALDKLECEVRWEGGIPPNPEYARCLEIVAVVKEFQPDIIIAVGGGSIIDGTKFIVCAAKLQDGEDPWEKIMIKKEAPETPYKFGVVLTIPATGSEWNNGFVLSRREMNWKIPAGFNTTYPVFSLLDPKYTASLPVRQLRNGVFDAFCHCVDQFATPVHCPMFDDFWMSIMKELVEIGADVVKPDSSLELRSRLVVAASFALNMIFSLGKPPCWEIHAIGHQITAKYDIDHGTSLAMIMPSFMRSQLTARQSMYAKIAEFVFGQKEGTEEEKAASLVKHVEKFIKDLGIPETVSKWEGVVIQEGDIELVAKNVMIQTNGGNPFGYNGLVTEEFTKKLLETVIV